MLGLNFNGEEMIKIATHRSSIYGSLAVCLLNPSEENIGKILGKRNIVKKVLECVEKLPKTSSFKTIGLLEKLANQIVGLDSLKLKVEYTRLFISSYPKVPCPPYESVYTTEDRLTMRENTLNVLRFYNRFGLGLVETFNEPPDHIAVELEFMYFLVSREAEAWKNNDKSEAYRYLEAEKEFLSKHLGVWVSDLHQCVEKHEKEIVFYRVMLCFLSEFIKEDLEFIETVLKGKKL